MEDQLTYGSLSAEHAFDEGDDRGGYVDSIYWPYLSNNDIAAVHQGAEVRAC